VGGSILLAVPTQTCNLPRQSESSLQLSFPSLGAFDGRQMGRSRIPPTLRPAFLCVLVLAWGCWSQSIPPYDVQGDTGIDRPYGDLMEPLEVESVDACAQKCLGC
jgi:hypothetical protein